MKRPTKNRKGQLSFDLAFAILMVLIVVTMLISYWTTSEASTNKAAKKAAYNSVAEYVRSNLNELYNSLRGAGGAADYNLTLPDEFSNAGADNTYAIDYQVTISGHDLLIKDGSGALVIQKELGFSSCGFTNAEPGRTLKFSGCTDSGNSISCNSCNIL